MQRLSPEAFAERLGVRYPRVTRDEWLGFCADRGWRSQQVVLLEFARFADAEPKAAYDAGLERVQPHLRRFGGRLVSVCDTLATGVGQMEDEDYSLGTAFFASLPSRLSYARMLLDEGYLELNEAQGHHPAAVTTMIGVDTIPAAARLRFRRRPAEDIPTPQVDGLSRTEVLDRLLAVYPDGGADPSRGQLETMLGFAGYADTPLQYINLYKRDPASPQGESREHRTYNRMAQRAVARHGVYPYFRCEVVLHLAGAVRWDLFVLPLWPSFKVFSDLRLDPGYIEAQKHRLDAAEGYGNIVCLPRSPKP